MPEREPPVHTRLRGLVLRADGEFDLLATFAQKLRVIVIARVHGVPEERSDDLSTHLTAARPRARSSRPRS